MTYDPWKSYVGNYGPADGTVEFFGRLQSLIGPEMTVLDLGAGRGSWFHQEARPVHRQLRALKGRVAKLIGADIDEAVLTNQTTDENVVIVDGKIPVPSGSVDLIMSDFVLEHIGDVADFTAEIDRVLKPGGMFCGRTPHSLHYVSIFARLFSHSKHISILKKAQPDREAQDIFPTHYRMNSIGALSRAFPAYDNQSYLYVAEPSYYFHNRVMHGVMSFLHRIAPAPLVANVFFFLRKPGGSAPTP